MSRTLEHGKDGPWPLPPAERRLRAHLSAKGDSGLGFTLLEQAIREERERIRAALHDAFGRSMHRAIDRVIDEVAP